MLQPEKPIADIVKVRTMTIRLVFRFNEFMNCKNGSIGALVSQLAKASKVPSIYFVDT